MLRHDTLKKCIIINLPASIMISLCLLFIHSSQGKRLLLSGYYSTDLSCPPTILLPLISDPLNSIEYFNILKN